MNKKGKMEKTQFNIGSHEGDAHLQKFYEILRELEQILYKKSCKTDLARVFFKLLFNAEDYFMSIEILLSKNAYPNLKKQKEFHRSFIDKVREIQQQYDQGEQDCCSKIYSFLNSWIEKYLAEYNNELVDFLNEKKLI